MRRLPSYKRSRSGLTLIEVIASVALLSTLLVGALVSHGKLSKQISRDRHRMHAMQLADDLMKGWVANGVIIPAREQGPLGGNEQYTWQTRRLPGGDIPNELQLIRLTVHHQEDVLFHIDVAAPRGGSEI